MSAVKEKPAPPSYSLKQVVAALLVFLVMICLLDAKGLHRWTQKLPVSERNAKLRKVTELLWAQTARWGLEEPKFILETAFLDFQEAHPLLYPHKYEDMLARKKAKEERRLAALALPAKPLPVRKKAVEAKKQSEDRNHKPRVLIIGDSIMASVGPSIKKDLVDKLAATAVVKAKVATGLARPDVFDWRAELRRATDVARFDYIVMLLGTNDSQDFAVQGQIFSYGTADWIKIYSERIATMMELSCKRAHRALWIGLPPMQSPAFNRKAVRINSLVKRQALQHSCVDYLPLEPILGDEKGDYAGYLKVNDSLAKVRMVDGIHITARGGDLVAETVVDRVRKDAVETKAAAGDAAVSVK